MNAYMHDRIYISSDGTVLGYNISLCKKLKNDKWVPLTQYQCAVNEEIFEVIEEQLGLIEKEKVEIAESFIRDSLVFAYSCGIPEETKICYQITSDLAESDFIYLKDKDLYFLKSFGIKILDSFEDFSRIMAVKY